MSLPMPPNKKGKYESKSKHRCPICRNLYSTKWDCKMHIKTVHNKIDVEPGVCKSNNSEKSQRNTVSIFNKVISRSEQIIENEVCDKTLHSNSIAENATSSNMITNESLVEKMFSM